MFVFCLYDPCFMDLANIFFKWTLLAFGTIIYPKSKNCLHLDQAQTVIEETISLV